MNNKNNNNNNLTICYLIKSDDKQTTNFLFKKALDKIKNNIDYNLPEYEVEITPPDLNCGSECLNINNKKIGITSI